MGEKGGWGRGERGGERQTTVETEILERNLHHSTREGGAEMKEKRERGDTALEVESAHKLFN